MAPLHLSQIIMNSDTFLLTTAVDFQLLNACIISQIT